MRPRRLAIPQSALQTPLNDILATETNLRLLRVLARTGHPLPVAELARRAMVHISGVAKALASLEEAGVVEYVGAGRRRPVALCATHPLAEPLRTLFRAEWSRYEAILHGLRQAARAIAPPPKAVWLEGSVTIGQDRPGDPVVVGILAGARDLDRAVSNFFDMLGDLERDLDVTVEVRGRTLADIAAAPDDVRTALEVVVPLLGAPPLAMLDNPPGHVARGAGRGRVASHADLDARARAHATEIAEQLRDDPSLVERARAYIAERLAVASPGEQRELREWEHVLRTMSLPRLRRFLVDPGERATRLRQTLPFLRAITSGSPHQAQPTRRRRTRSAREAESAVPSGPTRAHDDTGTP